MSVTAAALRELHRIHRQLSDLRSRLEHGPKQIRARETNVSRLKRELAEAKEHVTRTKVAADQKELQLREREQRIQNVRTKLNSASNNREYQAFLEQIAADEQANSVLSDETLELLEKIGELQVVVQRKVADLQQCEAEVLTLRQRVEAEKQSLEVDLARRTTELAHAEDCLPADVKVDYQRVVKARGEEALAPLEGDTCGSCFQTVTQQMVSELLMGKLVFCKSCGSLLYLPEDREVRRKSHE
jgi:predicted  nucleic acid-binding Zn-ribbon protein